jgi:hypothetical protein
MTIIHITADHMAEADAARKAALLKDPRFREHDEARQRRRDARARELEPRRLTPGAAAGDEARRRNPSYRPCPEVAQQQVRDIARDAEPQA